LVDEIILCYDALSKKTLKNIKKICRHVFAKSINIKYHENPSSGSGVVPRGHLDATKSWTGEWTDGQAEGLKDTTKIIVAFSSFAYAPKICLSNENKFCSVRCENSLNVIFMETNF